MHQADPFGDTGKEHCRLSSLLPISDYSNGSSFVHHGAASGIIVNTASQHFLLAFHTKLSGRRAGRQNDGRRLIGLFCRFNDLNQMCIRDRLHTGGTKQMTDIGKSDL